MLHAQHRWNCHCDKKHSQSVLVVKLQVLLATTDPPVQKDWYVQAHSQKGWLTHFGLLRQLALPKQPSWRFDLVLGRSNIVWDFLDTRDM